MRPIVLVALFGLVAGLMTGCQACLPDIPETPVSAFVKADPCAPLALGAAPTGLFDEACDQPVYTAACGDGQMPWNPNQGFGNTGPDGPFDRFLDNLFGCQPEPKQALAIPFGRQPLSACAPPAAAAPCATPLAAANDRNCGPLPSEARPGEVWCCVFVQPMAAAPQRVCVAAASQRCIPVPAVMGTQTRRVLVAPATTRWEKVDCGPSSDQRECYRLVEVPPQYRTETFSVVLKPASVRHETIPARYETVQSTPPPGYWEWQQTKDCEVPASAQASVAFPETDPPAGR